MPETDIKRFWELLGALLALKPGAFEQIYAQPVDANIALIIVLAAGLSQQIAQSIVLFVNRVKPLRFILCLIVGAVLFAFGYFFLVCSTSIISFSPFINRVPFRVLGKILGFSYAPLIFSFLGAMPYLGVPILRLLSLWSLLVMVVGLSVVLNTSVWQAFAAVGFGWFTLQLLQNTIGQPLADCGQWLINQVAGVQLVTQPQALLGIMQNRLLSWGNSDVRGSRGKQLKQNTSNALPNRSKSLRFRRTRQQIVGLFALGCITFVVMVILSPVQTWWFGWSTNLSSIPKLVLDLFWIGFIGIIVAGLLAPLEALGWWAGWYSDEADKKPNWQSDIQATPQPRIVSRYVVYLDGIGQSTFENLPDIQEFLEKLALALPEDVLLINNIMPYSVRNNPLTGDRPLGIFWRWANRLQVKNPASLLGYFVNIRNILVVAVSADQRYGKIYNFGIAKIIYQSLSKHGYQSDSGVPITLIGFSGGGQMTAGAAPFLRQALKAPIELISLAGVISANVNVLRLTHLYHLVGDKDTVERIGSIMFPGRWVILFLSYWNRAKRKGKISFISLGSVGHQLPGGLMDPNKFLPDGRSFLQQTIDLIVKIIRGTLPMKLTQKKKISNYKRYQQAAFNHPSYYPINQTVSHQLYRPIATWMGRLILPKVEERNAVRGVFFEVHHADSAYQHLVGQVVNLRWSNHPAVQADVQAISKDVHFNAEAEFSSKQGRVHPERINHWQQVNPLESLAGSRGEDDVIVMLPESTIVEETNGISDNQYSVSLYICQEPTQITGRFYGLVKFLHPLDRENNPPEQFRVVHFHRSSRRFDGVEETVQLPHAIANQEDIFPSTTNCIEQSPLNETGWFIYGANNIHGIFVVQAIAPRALLRLEPDRVIYGKKSALHYLKQRCWADIKAQKGQISSTLLTQQPNQSVEAWHNGDYALVIHVYGGIGGTKQEAATKSPLYFGHFAYGIAQVVWEPLCDELRFEINYHQVYTHNKEGIIAGTLHWSRFMGDRQFGWLGVRPVVDILIKLDAFTEEYETSDRQRSILLNLMRHLEAMSARYRIGNGTGGTYVTPANNCVQDANQAFYGSIQQLEGSIKSNPTLLKSWLKHFPQQAERFEQLVQLTYDLKRQLLPFNNLRPDWENHEYTLGISLEERPLKHLLKAIGSFRVILPRLASENITTIFIEQGAMVWVLRTLQVGGLDAEIEPVAPTNLHFWK
jgi:predicted Abi (CAAX) family protease